MSDRAEWWLHFWGIGFAYAALILWLSGSAVLAIFSPTLLSYARESEQARLKRMADNAMTAQRHRPGDVRYWTAHKWSEFLAVTAGAALAVGVYAVLR